MASPNPKLRTDKQPPGSQQLVTLTSRRDSNRLGSTGKVRSGAQEVLMANRVNVDDEAGARDTEPQRLWAFVGAGGDRYGEYRS